MQEYRVHYFYSQNSLLKKNETIDYCLTHQTSFLRSETSLGEL